MRTDKRFLADRRFAKLLLMVEGAFLGAVCFMLAKWLIPPSVSTLTEHDLALARNLGFVFTPIVATWLGLLQQSWKQVRRGCIIAIGLGVLYWFLCTSRSFLLIMVVYPMLLSGLLTALLGSPHENWLDRMPVRLFRGLVSGAVLGFVYSVALNLSMFLLLRQGERELGNVDLYIHEMGFAGPFALGLAGCLFFPLLTWSTEMKEITLDQALFCKHVKVSWATVALWTAMICIFAGLAYGSRMP